MSRETAGTELGRHLADRGKTGDIVLGLPRGGMVVAAEVARALGKPVDVLIVRKIGHPKHREFALGAIAEPDTVVLDRRSIDEYRVKEEEIEQIIVEETHRLTAYQEKFHFNQPLPLEGKSVIIVDDGLATGATAEAAAISARRQGATNITIAAPVASPSAMKRLCKVADDVTALIVDSEFTSVGSHYELFPQATDQQVTDLLVRTEWMYRI